MSKKYVPVLKTKQGEIWAVKHLDEIAKSKITPFFDVHRYVHNDAQKKVKPPEEHLSKVVKNLKDAWGIDRKFFLDIYDLDLKYRMSDGSHPISFLLEEFKKFQMNPVFCVGTDRDGDQTEAVKQSQPEEVCLRIHHEDLDELDQLNEDVEELLSELNLDKSRVYLLLDFRCLGNRSSDDVYSAVVEFSQSFDLREWKEFIVSASSFPEDMRDVERNTIAFFDRVELDIWRRLATGDTALYRTPIFSDYGINHPDKKEMDPKLITAAAKIRYALEDGWLIVRGYSLKLEDKFKQYHKLAAKLVEREEYLGDEYSWGDKFIYDCSQHVSTSGNLTKWVAVDTNHHLKLVSEQASSFPDS